MTRQEEHSVIRLCKICFIILLTVSCLYFAVYQFDEKPIDLDTTDAMILTGFRSTDRYGMVFDVKAETRYDFDENGIFAMSGTLPQGIRDESLCFLTFYDTEVYIDGQLIYRYNMEEDVHVIGGPVKNTYHFVRLDSSCSGRRLTIMHYQGTSADCRAATVYLGTVSDLYRVMFRKEGATFIMGLLILCLSLIILIFGLAVQYRTKQSADIVTIAVAVAMSAGWIVTDSYFYPFIFGHNHIDGLMSYCLCMLLPCPYILYVSSLQKGRYRKIYMILHVITLASFAVCMTLHFSGLVKLYQMIGYIDGLLVASIVVAVVILAREFRDGNIRAYRYTAIGIIGFMICGFGEILMILIPGLENNGAMLLVGLLWMLGFAVAQQIEDSRLLVLERQKALELSRAKSDFLASISHEIRTPINSILGMNEMILRENRDPEIRGYAGTIQRSGKMLLSLINDVLDYSRIEAGKMEIVEEDYRLSDLIADVALIAKERAEQKGLECTVSIGYPIPDGLHSDEVRIKQILLNLISNAVKYTDEGGIGITVGGTYRDDETFELEFEVRDTGRGIREEDLKHLFEAFSRSDMKKNRNIEGTGLGLAIVKSITDSMNGMIRVESEYRKGSVFSVRLPQKVTDRTPVPARLKEMPAAEETKTRHPFTAPEAAILVVDDNRPNLSIVNAFLKDTKARIDLCTNGREAADRCRKTKYDLILLDHMMPEPDGIQTLEMIRTDSESLNRDTAAVVLTANALSGSRQMYLKAGFTDYLAKPLEADVLEDTVRRLLPAEKVRDAADGEQEQEEEVMEFEASGSEDVPGNEIPEALRKIQGVDADEALLHTGGNGSLLKEILWDIASAAPEAANELRQAAESKDYEKYRITAHSIKGLMSTIGAREISAAAKRHEYAAKNGEYVFIGEHYGSFAKNYETLCFQILEALKEKEK